MPIEITIPRLGWQMEEGVFGEWLKAAGELVRAGDTVYLLEGEKATHEIESLDTGVLCVPDDAPQPGDTVQVGQVIGFLLGEGEAAPASVRTRRGARGGAAPAAETTLITETSPAPTGSPVPAAAIVARAADRRTQAVATPRARRRATELGVDWTGIYGTGRGGRIRERDVLAFAASRPTNGAGAALEHEWAPRAPGRHQPASGMRRTIAQRMLAGIHQTAPVTLTTKVDAAAFVALRERWKREAQGAAVPSYNDMLVKLAAVALKEQPQLNACWHRDGIYTYDVIHIAVAVDAPAGLVAPVIEHADQLTVVQIAERSRALIEQARAGTLSQDQLEGGTFTITNLGMFEIDSFTPIINLPQTAILGVGRIVQEPVVREGRIEIGETMSLSLTFDHRVVDGAPAARWLQRLAHLIRCPELA